jgi:hypothetical protein
MDIVYGLSISFVFIASSVWVALKLWDLIARDFEDRANRELDPERRMRRGVRNTDDRGRDGGGDAFGDGGFGGGGFGDGGA